MPGLFCSGVTLRYGIEKDLDSDPDALNTTRKCKLSPPVTASHQGSYSLSQIKKVFKYKIERIFPSAYSKMKSRDLFPHQPKQKEHLTFAPFITASQYHVIASIATKKFPLT